MEHQINNKDIIFDVFDYNYSWGFYYKGHLIKENGDLFSYSLTQKDIEEVKYDQLLLLYKKKNVKSTFIKTISDEMMIELKTLLNSLNVKSCTEKREVNGYDMPHHEYYGYNNDKDVYIHLYSTGERTCNYENDDISEKNVLKLVKLLTILIPSSSNVYNECRYCHKQDADYIDLDSMSVYCNEECRDNDELYGSKEKEEPARVVDQPDVPVMMMRDQSGRQRKHIDK